MNILVILVSGLLGVNAFKLKGATVNEDEMYVVGGRDAKPGDAPWQISMRSEKSGHMCGGSLINARHVLTAAHCCRGKSEVEMAVWFGGLRLWGLENSIEVSEVIIHPNFTKTTDNDYCVLKLAKDAVESDQVKFIKIAEKAPASGTPCKLTGWGATNAEMTDKLQIAELNILGSVECDHTWKKAEPKIKDVTKNMICAVSKTASSCNGDSGGPLIVNNELVGIVSWGAIGCPPDTTVTPAVFADPTEPHARQWIRMNTE